MWRDARSNDDEIIIEMCRELNREDPGPHLVPDSHMERTLAALRAEKTRGKAVILELDNKVEGYALLISFWSNELGGEVCNIDEFYVRASSRGLGHASELVESLISGTPLWAQRPAAIELEVTPQNSKARALYSKLGFEIATNAHMQRRLP